MQHSRKNVTGKEMQVTVRIYSHIESRSRSRKFERFPFSQRCLNTVVSCFAPACRPTTAAKKRDNSLNRALMDCHRSWQRHRYCFSNLMDLCPTQKIAGSRLQRAVPRAYFKLLYRPLRQQDGQLTYQRCRIYLRYLPVR